MYLCDSCQSHVGRVREVTACVSVDGKQTDQVTLCDDCLERAMRILFSIMPAYIGERWLALVRSGAAREEAANE